MEVCTLNLVLRTLAGDNPSRIAALRDHVLEIAVRDFGASFSGEHGIAAPIRRLMMSLPRWPYRNTRRRCRCFCAHPAAAVRSGRRDARRET